MKFLTSVFIPYITIYSISVRSLYITPSRLQTKQWRTTTEWYKTGKSNECELYQVRLLEQITKQKIHKTDERINIETAEIISVKHPMKLKNGYDFTENFDGKIITPQYKFYFNLKFICDSGGAQTRTLREVYHFIRYQLEHLMKYEESRQNTIFVNILDGDTSYKNMDKFQYLLEREKYKSVKSNVFIEDMETFSKRAIFVKEVETA